MTKKKTRQFDKRLDAEANALWIELEENRQDLISLGKERRRLTELLPWWAAPGRQLIDSEGQLCGDVVWYPAIQLFALPKEGMRKLIRPSTYDIDRIGQNPFFPRERIAATQRQEREAYNERIAAQKTAQREVGLTALHRQLRRKEYRRWFIRDNLTLLAERGSPAAIAGRILFEFADPYGYGGQLTMRDKGRALPAVLKLALPHCTGLLRKHVSLLLNHPKKEQRTCNFVRLPADVIWGFVPLDRDRIPGFGSTPQEQSAA
jgi:hypothetical protein